MAELGFAGVIEKFEEHWGRRAAKGLLMIIGLGVVAICLGAIWQWLISPILTFLSSPDRQRTIVAAGVAAVGIGGGIAFGMSLYAAFSRWRAARKVKQKVAEAARFASEAQRLNDENWDMIEIMVGWMRRIVEVSEWEDPKDRATAFAVIQDGERRVAEHRKRREDRER